MSSLLLRLSLTFFLLLNLVAGDADFYDVRTRLSEDHSGHLSTRYYKKYFRESTFHPHYDGRFASSEVPEEQRLTVLTNMVKTFLSTMDDIGAETWIMHGTLLGWYWNQKILPWDTDVDVQVSMPTIELLASYYNMTEYHYQLPGGGKGTYLLEVNPNWSYGGVDDKLNRIDARWIDTNHGLFIDISTVRPDMHMRAQGVEGAMIVKDTHHYRESDIFPLRDSFFEGVHVKIPFEYVSLLGEEYGEQGLTAKQWEGHEFNDHSKLWEPMIAQYTVDGGQVNSPEPHWQPDQNLSEKDSQSPNEGLPQYMSRTGPRPPRRR